MKNFLKVTPESVGISSQALLGLMQRLSKLEYLNSIMILRHGKLCLEAWMKPYERNMVHQLFSLSKSFTSCAIGIAQGEGLLSIHDKLVKFFPEYMDCITDERMKDVTLQDLLTMRSGHLSCPTGIPEFWTSDDWCKFYLSTRLDCQPGTEFTYNSVASYMLSAVISKVAHCNVREYLLPRLFEVLGIAPGIWECSPQGINCGGWGLYLKTEDIARFAQMLLQKGVWEGRQVVPADYLADAVRFHADNSKNAAPDWKFGYGYQFWLSQHGYRGDGAAGQYAIVLPEEDIAIAVTSCVGNMQNILTAFWEELIPAVQADALPEDPAAFSELTALLETLAIPVVEGDTSRRSGNVSWVFADNPEGVKSCQVNFGSTDVSLIFDGPCGVEELRAGFGYHAPSYLQLTDRRKHPVFASAAWKSDHILEIRTFIADGVYKDVWVIDFSDPVEPLKNQMFCSCFRPGKPRLLVKSC